MSQRAQCYVHRDAKKQQQPQFYSEKGISKTFKTVINYISIQILEYKFEVSENRAPNLRFPRQIISNSQTKRVDSRRAHPGSSCLF